MKYISMFSGIEAATVAWHPLGWEPLAFCEIEPFPSAVLAHHYPNVPNLGDVTKANFDEIERPELVVFGSPCQSFSVAGKRLGLDDPRGNLALYALGVVNRLRPRWFIFENVPGLLSSGGGRDFGAFLGAVGECGFGCAWRVLDAQHFGVPQRRRRVFVVGYLGDWRPAAAVLFERHSLQGHSPPRREAGEGVAAVAAIGSYGGGLGNEGPIAPALQACGGHDERGVRNAIIAHTLNAKGGSGRSDGESETFVTHTLRGDGFDASEDGTGRGTPLVPVAFGWQNSASQGDSVSEHVTPSLDKSKVPGVCHGIDGVSGTLRANPGSGLRSDGSNVEPLVSYGSAVRRLTPRECERLQGFPDDYTLIPMGKRSKKAEQRELSDFAARTGQDDIKWSADGPRYKALGNSMAVPVMRWIGQRISQVSEIVR